MDWTFDGADADFMSFDLGNGDIWSFDVADGPLDFEPTDLHTLQTSTLGSDALMNPLQIDPALVSPESNDHEDLFGLPGNQKVNERRRPERAHIFMPNLKTDLSAGSRLVFGQVTPPSSVSSASPPIAPLDTVDPTAVMPVAEQQPELEPNQLSTSTATTTTTTTTSNSSTSPTKPTASTSNLQSAPSGEAAPVKPKSKRGRKKKILAPAARDAQRARTLARNRAAAQRCRQRKKVEHAALEARARGLARDRAALHTLVGSLRDELLSLKGQMLRHASCADADSGVAAYVKQQREMLLRGMPEDETVLAGPVNDEDNDFLRELGIDPKDPTGEDNEEEYEDEDDDELEQDAEEKDDDDDDDAEGDDDTVSQTQMPHPPSLPKNESTHMSDLLEATAEAQDTSDSGISKRLRRRPRRTAKARTSS